MNIIKLQDMLRGVPDDALIGYVQNPQGQVPSYLALSELQRRKDTRAKYQTEQAPESSVAEDLGQQAQPPAPQAMPAGQPQMQMEDQGVAALPTGDMFQEQNFAGGGIVAFADGGETGMNLDRLPTLNINTGMQSGGGSMGGDAMYSFNDNAAMSPIARMLLPQMSQSDRAKFLGSGMGAFFGMQEKPKQDYYTSSGALTSSYAKGGGVNYDDGSVGYPIGGYVVPAAIGAAKYGLRGLKYLKDKAIGTSKIKAPTMNLPTGPVTPILEQGTKGFLQKPGFYVDTAVIGGTIYGINQYGEKEQISAEEARKVALAKEKAAKELADKEAAAKRATESPKNAAPAEEKIKSIGDYAKDLQDYVGTDPNAAAQRERLLKMEERATRREEMAPYLALTEAGFKTMQGTSPFALANIGAGAQAGLQSYAAAQDKIADLEEKRNALALGLDQAQRSERIAFAQFGATSKQAEETRRATKQIADQKLMVDLLIADGKNQNALQVAGTLKPGEQGKIANEVINDPKFQAWQDNWFEKNGEKYDEESPEFQIAYNNELARRVGLRAGQNVPPTNYGGFNVIK